MYRLQKFALLKSCKHLSLLFLKYFFLLYINVNWILSTKRKASKKAPEKYQDLSEEEKNKKRQYCLNDIQNLPEHEKQRLFANRKKCSKMWKIKTSLLFYSYMIFLNEYIKLFLHNFEKVFIECARSVHEI